MPLSAIRDVVKGAAMTNATKPYSWSAWLAPVSVNVVLGSVGVIPLAFVWMFLAQYPLAALGLTERDPTDNDGILPWLVLLGAVGLFFILWTVINKVTRRVTRLPNRSYWWVSVIISLTPFVFFAVFPDAWTALG
ncbi:hypothetical protein Aple_078700 [Acrocarpospora pleiomorpha]|uniref:Integral membrane protein n=1 Tax=Acrocarpospora pleiomorpha TaxID=90975 RepID=A0A5M3XZJ4_9ACTN|nr:hypothetical protein [Acrocarpospora pleiomorpha]GES24971.1 hypothetical protein Aple_078700 [Acrocarpospora pleiomorpha]